MSSSPKEATTTTPLTNTNNKRQLSSEPDAPAQDTSKRANTKTEDDQEDDITADDKVQPTTTTSTDETKPKMSGDDVAMENTEEAAAPTTSTTTAPAESAPSSSTLPPPATEAPEPAPQQIQMRCLIVTQDASVIIGKAGKHVNEIREKSGARVTVSESIPGNPERILHVSGALDAVSKAFGLIVRRINDEPFDVSSVPGSRAVTIKFIIPNSRMGTVIGKGGSKIKEIQEASGARLNASEAMLPGSTERVLSVSGVADAIHIAVYYIGNILLEYQDRPSAPGSSRDTYRQAGGRDSGSYAGGDRSERREPRQSGIDVNGPGVQTQQIFIPNDLVGSIIGKAGAKINEIRTASQTQIRIMEPGQPGASANTDERLVTITGQPTGINMAIQLLYQRLEQEKAARLQSA